MVWQRAHCFKACSTTNLSLNASNWTLPDIVTNIAPSNTIHRHAGDKQRAMVLSSSVAVVGVCRPGAAIVALFTLRDGCNRLGAEEAFAVECAATYRQFC
jgi:hypothetical protein